MIQGVWSEAFQVEIIVLFLLVCPKPCTDILQHPTKRLVHIAGA